MKKINKNKFFDINQFPHQEGILVFPISISKIGNIQSAKKCFNYIKSIENKIIKPVIGVNFVYADNLYLYSDEKANKLKNKLQTSINSHKNHFLNILDKNQWYIQKSFSFTTWNQLLLESGKFQDYFGRLQKRYNKDKKFKKYVNEDVKNSKKKLTKNNILFILEEILVVYLTTKGKLRLFNEYIQDKEKWILFCYPGKPLYSEIYLYQQEMVVPHGVANNTLLRNHFCKQDP